jgi:hypothetical protein
MTIVCAYLISVIGLPEVRRLEVGLCYAAQCRLYQHVHAALPRTKLKIIMPTACHLTDIWMSDAAAGLACVTGRMSGENPSNRKVAYWFEIAQPRSELCHLNHSISLPAVS